MNPSLIASALRSLADAFEADAPVDDKSEQLLTYQEVADRLRIAESTARTMGKSGRYWQEVRFGRSPRVRKADLDLYIRTPTKLRRLA